MVIPIQSNFLIDPNIRSRSNPQKNHVVTRRNTCYRIIISDILPYCMCILIVEAKIMRIRLTILTFVVQNTSEDQDKNLNEDTSHAYRKLEQDYRK